MDDIELSAEGVRGSPRPPPLARRDFQTTRWSVVLRAGRAGAAEALAALCAAYREPIRVFVCRLGVAPEDADDVTQGFIAATLLEGRYLETVAPERGRFRAWLRACVRHYVYNWKKREGRERARCVSLDASAGAASLGDATLESHAVDRAFDRECARRTVELAKARFLRHFAESPLLPLAEDVLCVAGDPSRRESAELRRLLGVSEANLRTKRHRMLHGDFARAMREEVAEIVASPADIDAEIRLLLEALA